MKIFQTALTPILSIIIGLGATVSYAQRKTADPRADGSYATYALFAKTAARPETVAPMETQLPLTLSKGTRIALIGNTLLDRSHRFGFFESMLQAAHPNLELVVRNLAWSADEPNLQPRPANFADTDQHLRHEKADVIFAAYGFNESFKGDAGLEAFEKTLTDYIATLKTKAFNGKTGPRIILVSPIANENIEGVAAASLNNSNIKKYTQAMKKVAAAQKIGFVDVFTDTQKHMEGDRDLTINGAHLNQDGYALFSGLLFEGTFGKEAPRTPSRLVEAVKEKNRQYFRRFRPLNTFYYTGGRNRSYGYLDFLPAMQSFDVMVENRDAHIWRLAQKKEAPNHVSDSNVPDMPAVKQSRGANKWMTAADELKAFKIDPRFEVNLFAGEEDFPELAAPIQMRWDSKGRLWVSCSTTYPHVYPGNEPNDKIVILSDTDKDGKADKCEVFADNLEVPLSFVLYKKGVLVSEEPHLSYIEDSDGDGKADKRTHLLTGFGCEDSHHALHDFVWTPDGDLIFRESIFHHSQVETPYGPVRQQNSGWFRYNPRSHKLLSFGSYGSTNPWGVTFDDWGQHMASHPVFASAFHALDPAYPKQHPRPGGLQAYSGVCGQEFVDFKTWPEELQGHFIKVRYKPTNKVEIHQWIETPFGYEEKFVGDLIFSSNLSFIPVDLRYGPRGAMYICDWYNPVKGHAQYALRDERRDRKSGRIWRITAKGRDLQEPPRIDGASIPALLDIMKRPEYRYRYWAKRELRGRDFKEVTTALGQWLAKLDPKDPRYRHHQVEAIWNYRNVDAVNTDLLREVLACENHHARAAATRQLRYWNRYLRDGIALLNKAADDPNGLVRLEAVNAASYIGGKKALDAISPVFNHPRDKHLKYAISCALGSHTLKPFWENDPASKIATLLRKSEVDRSLKSKKKLSKQEKAFDRQKNLKKVLIDCVHEQIKFDIKKFNVKPGQPVQLTLTNSDATDHNLVITKPGRAEAVGTAANEMAKDPKNINSDFIPPSYRKELIAYTKMIGPMRKSKIHVLRFKAPTEPGIYPYICTFPGHWTIMRGDMIVE